MAAADPEPALPQSGASGLGRTASTNGGATAALLHPTGHTHTDLLATPQQAAAPSPGGHCPNSQYPLNHRAPSGQQTFSTVAILCANQDCCHMLIAAGTLVALLAGSAHKTDGTTAHLLDFTAASANHFGRHSTAKRASAAGSLMDDDMQVRPLTY